MSQLSNEETQKLYAEIMGLIDDLDIDEWFENENWDWILFSGFDYNEKFADISKILDERKKKGEEGDLSLLIRLSIEKGNNISRWVQWVSEPQRKVVLTLKEAYGLVDAKTDRNCLTLSRVALLFPIETCTLMRKCKTVLSVNNLKTFVPHIDAAVMHPAFNLLVPKSLKKILELTMVLNALWTLKIGKQKTKEKPLHEVLNEVKVFVDKKFENKYINEEKRKMSMIDLGFCKMEKCPLETEGGVEPKPVYTPNRDFVAMILEGSRLYETIKSEKWKTLWKSSSKYKQYCAEELAEKITEFIDEFRANQ